MQRVLVKTVRLSAARSLSLVASRTLLREPLRAITLEAGRGSTAALANGRYPQQFIAHAKRMYSSSLPTHKKIPLPALSPTMETGTIVSWQKKEGDKISEGDVLAEIETDKATMSFEAIDSGYLARIIQSAGTKDIPLGALLCIIVKKQEDVAAFRSYQPTEAELKPVKGAKGKPAPAAAAAPAPAPQPVRAPAQPAPQVAPQAPAPQPAQSGDRVLASPLAKVTAAQKGVDLRAVGAGSGEGGRIRAADVEAFAASGAAAQAQPQAQPFVQTAAPPAPSGAAYTDIPLTNMRAVIAKRLTTAKQSIPHYYLSAEINMDKILDLRKEMNDMLAKDSVKLSINDFIIKASAAACRKVPEVNSSWQDSFIRQFHDVDVSVAVATKTGLITPIVFRADNKGLVEINRDMARLAAKAREGKLLPQEFQGGTFTISNLGMFGVSHFTAIINPPQSCILAVGTTDKRLVPDDSERGFRVANMTTVTLSCDHRVVDGAVGAEWLKHLKLLLEKPYTIIM